MKDIRIGNNYPVFIIAEAGVNHNGKASLAIKMIDAAKKAEADAIKFQTFRTEDLVVKNKKTDSHFKMLKKLELKEKDFESLNNYCRKKKIIFLSTPFDSKSAAFLRKLGMPAFKIASGELTNTPLLKQIAGYGKPVILSTGMATLKEVKEAVKAIYSAGNKRLALLHCTSNYPARYEDVNLKAMDTLREEFKVTTGYSDHTPGIEVSVAAVAMGAKVIEKHFTLDKDLSGPDHRASIEPDEFRALVRAVRNIEKATGSGIKSPCGTEIKTKRIARKSITADCRIPKGIRITGDMLGIKRPGTGIEPLYLSRVINKKARVNIEKGRVLRWALLR